MARWCSFLLIAVFSCADPTPGAEGPTGQTGLRGPAGPMGERGETGAPGKDATPASAYRPLYWVACIATLDLIKGVDSDLQRGADGVGETSLQHSLLLYNDHDVEVQCSAAIGRAQSSAQASYYPSITVGAKSALCVVDADYPGGTGNTVGYWSFSVENGGPQTQYKDPDNPLGLDGYVYKFAETDCNSNTLDDDGVWSHVTLSDVF